MVVKAGICVAYDWRMLEHSLPSIYNYVDVICLSIDADRKTWNGNPFDIDWNAFTELVHNIDINNKISILQESFYSADQVPIANECYQRKRMADVLGNADWIVQIDADEILINPPDFISVLKAYCGCSRPVNIHGTWVNLIKHTGTGYIYSVTKTPPLATNKPVYEYGRTNGHFSMYTNTFVGHVTWARPETEVYYKLMNWGHSHEFNGLSFFKIWQALDEHNWKYIKNFHPMNNGSISRLYFQFANDIASFIQAFDAQPHHITFREFLRNNIWVSRANKIFKSLRDVFSKSRKSHGKVKI